MMHFQIPKQDILAQLIHQLENYFLLDDMEKTIINEYYAAALEKCDINFMASTNKYFKIDAGGKKMTRFNPYHSVQYMIFFVLSFS